MSAPALNSQSLAGTTDEQNRWHHPRRHAGHRDAVVKAYGGPLTDQQITGSVAYIRSWEKTAPSCPDWPWGRETQ